jgi:hypothetical protein
MKVNKQMFLKLLLPGVILIFTAACEQQGQTPPAVTANPEATSVTAQVSGQQDTQVEVTLIEFNEVEDGTEPFPSRMMISDRYIRIDEGSESGGYVLFDRLKRRIFSVVDENESIVVVDPLFPLATVPDDLNIRFELKQLEGVPEISGIKPVYYQFYANDTLCYHLVAADGLLPEVTQALRSYQSVLAAQQQESLSIMPTELQTPCFLANYIYAPELYITKGFPIEQWDVSGYHRSLSTIKENEKVEQSLFALPSEYRYFSIGSGNFNL